MAAATAAILPPATDFVNMDHRSADSHRMSPASFADASLANGRPLRSAKSVPSPSTPTSPFRLRGTPHSPSIPHRRVYNIDDESITSTSHSFASETRSSDASITPSQSASNVSAPASPRSYAHLALPLPPSSPGSPSRPLAHKKSAERRRKATRNQHLTNLEVASLSTPELHLASDPMLDTQEPSFLRKLVRGSRAHSNDAVSSAGSEGQTQASSHTDNASSRLGVSPGLAYSSFAAAMSAVDACEDSSQPDANPQVHCFRKKSTSTLRSADSEVSRASWSILNTSTDTLSPPKDINVRSSPTKSEPKSSAGTWFRRHRQQSDPSRKLNQNFDASGANSSTQVSVQRSQMSDATVGSGTTLLSQSNYTGLSSATTASFDLSELASPQAALESIRKARSFMIRELGRIAEPGDASDKPRISALVSQASLEVHDLHSEASSFWHSIADGVLLCLLANRLRPGSVDRIDRRDLEWVKSNNISRFLRAARDHLGLRSKDLFQTFDLTDSTVGGLLRVVHTLQATEKMARRSSKVTAARANAIKIEPRTTSMTPPTTPRAQDRKMLPVGNGDLECIENSSELFLNDDTPKRAVLSIQQNRREAERILIGKSDSSRYTSTSFDAKRRSIELGHPKPKGSSITFADSVKQNSYSADDDNRLPYRDRKLSESVISLTGVAEEPEDGVVTNDDSLPTAESFSTSSTPSVSMELSQVRRGSSESDKSTKSFAVKPPLLARSTSQKRISQELALGQLPRAVIGSTENLDDYLFISGSPTRHAPTRRHSARLYAGPSLLNPSRESLLNLGSQANGESDALASSRVPFPRGANDSPGARRMARHLSMNAGVSDTISTASGPSTAIATNGSSSSSKVSSRPHFRHMRYSSDLHLPSMSRPTSVGGRSPDPSVDERSYISTSRSRFDSEIGSIYTNTLGSLPTDESGSTTTRASRDATGPKHKIVVAEEGKPSVTYQLGNCIGRGQFGSVYRALNLNSGRMVAVKRIKLEGRTDEEINDLMGEVDLLKSLTHPSVVKYEGLVRGPDVVSIILEFVENGSLLHTLKAFGNFPEKLVASYVVKILEGLNYLHGQNVVHCDLKAANILTTKQGNVKLSDFGVSLNLKAVKKMGNKNDAIGTPNWMAPEVIELKGVTTAADIWSLGCTIIELLTGKPPYYDMLAMSAMFRIVEDDCPPIPEKCSDALRDLLMQCFNKDPAKRPSAEMLFEHEWMQQVWSGHKDLRELRPQDSVPFLRRISADARRLDPRIFEEDERAVQPAMERSTSSPAPTLQRPGLEALRANTSPAESLAAVATEMANGVSPTTSPAVHSNPLPSVDTSSKNQAQSPALTPANPTVFLPAGETSMLDLGLMAEEEAKPHAFVKSTFSKAVVCKICREPVKKHAVLCEECGLVCHARCAVHAPSPCNLRAQLLLFQQRASMDQTSPMSSAAQLAPVSPMLAGGAPNAAVPINFRFPFGMKRQSKSPTADSQPQLGLVASASSETEVRGSPSPPTGNGVTAAKPAKDQAAVRKRRISLIPGRQRSPSPPPAETPEAMRSPYGNGALHGTRRHSSMSYGSISGASSISSAGGILLGHSSSRGSSAQQHQAQQAHPHASTPVLPVEQLHARPSKERFRRRLSSGVVTSGARAEALSAKHTTKGGVSTGQVTPTPRSANERQKSRRSSSKADCTIM